MSSCILAIDLCLTDDEHYYQVDIRVTVFVELDKPCSYCLPFDQTGIAIQ